MSTSTSPAPTLTPTRTARPYKSRGALDLFITLREELVECPGARAAECARGQGKQRCLPDEKTRGLESESR